MHTHIIAKIQAHAEANGCTLTLAVACITNAVTYCGTGSNADIHEAQKNASATKHVHVQTEKKD